MIKKLTSQILAFTDTRYIEAQKNIIKKLIHEAESQGYHEARNKFSGQAVNNPVEIAGIDYNYNKNKYMGD